jgi:hypothetical protein
MIAEKAGISPTTVRDVRERMLRGEDPVPTSLLRRRSGVHQKRQAENNEKERRPKDVERARGRLTLIKDLCRDPSLRLTQPGRHFLRWLSHRAAPLQIQPDQLDVLPSHSMFLVIAIARQCADEWNEFARELEERVQQATP